MSNELEVLFPEKEIPIGRDKKMVMVPISLGKIPKVFGTFTKILEHTASAGVENQAALGVLIANEVMELLPYCTQTPLDDIPSTVLPDILDTFIEQNLSDAVMGKWKALAGKVTAKFGKMNPEPSQSLPKH
jgi:hypothetical protein